MIEEIMSKSTLDEVLEGLKKSPKKISSKYFYDKKGSELFDQICELDEYYPTRTEFSILKNNMSSIAECFSDNSLLVEFGSGSSTKTRLLLENIKNLGGYIPIDISKKHLDETVDKLHTEFPTLEIQQLAADYTKPIVLPKIHDDAEQRIIFFPGSTLGNFTKTQSREFLKVVRDEMRKGDGFILGVDLVKDENILLAAYNDSKNITAEFNLNILQNLNNTFESDFILSNFKHDAIYNKIENRIEMYLISKVDQEVNIGTEKFIFHSDEKILTEYSHKYTLEIIEELCKGLFKISKVWTDPQNYFAELYLEPI